MLLYEQKVTILSDDILLLFGLVCVSKNDFTIAIATNLLSMTLVDII